MKAAAVNKLQAARGHLSPNVVRVDIPASAYFNLDHFNKVHASILGRLGCPGCTSGWDIRFRLQQRFFVDEKLNILDVPIGRF